MATLRAAVLLLAVSALAAPAAASWGAKGSHEPDTVFDEGAGMMWADPDQDPNPHLRRVYFNGYLASTAVFPNAVNPNSATLRSGHQAYPFQAYALLGVWKDCNRDGYVGLGDNALLEYRFELLPADHVCPVSADRLAHNDGAWVRELVPIGYDDTRTELSGGVGVDENPYNFNDTRSRVWADWGAPGQPARPTCATVPPPTGTFRSTGGLLRWADCSTGHQGVAALGDALEAAGLGHLSFDDAPRDRPDRSGSPLNRENPWGDESDGTMVTVFDCSRPPTQVEVSDPTDPGDGSGRLHTLAHAPALGLYVNGTDDRGRVVHREVRPPVVPRLEPGGSPAGTVNQTQAALDDCDRSDEGSLLAYDGRPAGSDGNAPYALERAHEPTTSGPRAKNDLVLKFEEGERRPLPVSPLVGDAFRTDAGAGQTSTIGLWVGTSVTVVGRNPYVRTENAQPEGVTYVTFYAHVSLTLLEAHGLVTAGPYRAYGAEGCGESPPTVECDEAKWWRDAEGRDAMPRDARLGHPPGDPITPARTPETEVGVRVNHPYNLLDVDCYDASAWPARERGAHWGLVNGEPCARPATPPPT